jgi:hypothetical protein
LEPCGWSTVEGPCCTGARPRFAGSSDLLDGVETAGGALVVRGEAGIGKSALLAGACRLAATAPKDGQL